jgi:hypothetical protein
MWFSEHVRKVFGEMTKRTRIEFWFDFSPLVSHVFLLTPFRIFTVIPDPVPRADSLSIASRS